MHLIACDGTWHTGSAGEVICSGTLQIVTGGGLFGLPPITYTEANLLLAAISGLWASVFVFKQAKRLF